MKLLDREVLYVDNHLLVVDKAQGLLSQPTNLDEDSVEGRAKEWLKERYNKPGNVFLHAVHRLDRLVGGILVCARTSKALSRLQESIRNNDWKKTYRARHQGRMPQKEGLLQDYLIHGDYRAERVDAKHPEGKLAELYYKVMGEGLLEIDLLTGRYHQIRAQLAYRGCPIAGDKKYGSTLPSRSSGIDLHHIRLVCHHPITKSEMIFESKPSF